jgi:glutaredoxin
MSADIGETLNGLIASGKVVVFSKSYCPYCTRVKKLLSSLKVEYQAYELDNMQEGDDLQNELLRKTGQRTVPNVFVNGNSIGGCDSTTALHNKGKLLPLINGEE